MDAKVALGLAFLVTIPALAVMAAGRAGLTNFVRWHRLDLPDEWGAPVTRYLSQARRSRIWGMAAGMVLPLLWLLPQQRIAVDFLAMSAGWLLGGMLAEFRLFRSGAALKPPHPLPRWLRATPAVAAVLTVPVTVLCVLADPGDPIVVAAWGLAALTACAVVAGTVRHVARRPSLQGAPVEVDRAIRDRAAAGLTAFGVLVTVQCLLRQADLLTPRLTGATQDVVTEAGWLWVFGGLLLALSVWWATPPVRRGPVPAVLGLMLVAATAGWVGAGVARDTPPYGPEAVQATARLRLATSQTHQADAAALKMAWADRGWTGGNDIVQLLGRVDLTLPPQRSPDDRHQVFVVDTRTNTTVTVYGQYGAGWDGYLYELADRYPWLSALRPGGTTHEQPMAVDATTEDPASITFSNDFGRASAPQLSDLAVVLVFTGPQQQIYWATRVPIALT
ncbi:hypothetical protein ACFQY4_42255 [Catellatospora bangladeshensis]|uniref:Uncharacterized protein n=1 Tax=Catellatospora bangladeshensis TaxID=310355 RepID=A0A8J3JC68_9ACTN|nr:hypothetical protein [Catellatospora bangladeshensis]GIF79949.1 hypothetical protein Cba03nite_12980 [Catellatospora bangladeshensis]